MKITVNNLGVIRQASINLKPLTVFVGHNGEGKTWAAYTIAAIFSPYGFEKYVDNCMEGKNKQKYPELDRVIEDMFNDRSSKIDIVDFVKKNIESYVNDVASLAPSWMRSFLSTQRVDFENLKIDIGLNGCKTKLAESVKTATFYGNISILSKEFHFLKEANSKQTYFFIESKQTKNKEKEKEIIPHQIIRRFVYDSVFEILHRAFFFNTHLFPTERTALMTLPISMKKLEQRIRDSQPIERFIGMIFHASSVSLEDRKEEIKADSRIGDYLQLADILEEKILLGKGDFEASAMGKELLFSNRNIKLEIGASSSMVKELVSLVLYLRYIAQPNDLVVIDEPEMNLHPAAQTQIIEFLAMLVNFGLRVLITTHSPYILDHLSNLIEAKKHTHSKEIEEYFYLEDSNAFIEQNQVSVYSFEEGSVTNILGKDGSIAWETFGNVSSDISEIYSELLKSRK